MNITIDTETKEGLMYGTSFRVNSRREKRGEKVSNPDRRKDEGWRYKELKKVIIVKGEKVRKVWKAIKKRRMKTKEEKDH